MICYRKWENFAVMKRMGSSVSVTRNEARDREGHFVVFTADQKRFMILLCDFKTTIAVSLKRSLGYRLMGLSHCLVMHHLWRLEYIIMLIEQPAAKDLEQALLIMSVDTSCRTSLSLLHGEQTNQRRLLLVCHC
ncbi:hypothetical protein CICLE_v10029899mg [Citrus x clementina]|uniref:Uncharacterized protein n=1 Tax=Citrus clementina TaxID=85681 RepID=V4SFB8_CITCL|nr:hypothetical protein CICLE_v10029899mg [Citrus x clementina]